MRSRCLLAPLVVPFCPLLLLVFAIVVSIPAGSAQAAPVGALLDPSQSAVGAAPLSGTIDLDIGDGPPTGLRSFDVTGLAVTGGGLSVAIDDRLANPGLGLIRPDETFLIPALFVVVEGLGDPLALTLIDIAGTFGPSAACGASPACLETAFQIDTGGEQGVLDVSIVAAVPEPGTGLLVALGLAAVAVARRGSERSAR